MAGDPQREEKMSIKNENYIVIQGFMVNELNLKGNELLVYAIIYGFAQIEGQKFKGSLSYLSSWLNSSKQTVINTLKSLLDKKMIIKEEKFINGIKFCEYSCNKNYKKDDDENLTGGQKSLMGYSKNLTGGSQNFGHNNIFNNIKDNIDDDTKLDKLNKIEDVKKLDEPKEEKEVRPTVSSSIEFKNDLKELKDIAVKSTGINKMLIDNTMLPSKYRDINIRELINKIKESKFLLGELDTKPNINHFSVRNMIDRIMADAYKDKPEVKPVSSNAGCTVKRIPDETNAYIGEDDTGVIRWIFFDEKLGEGA